MSAALWCLFFYTLYHHTSHVAESAAGNCSLFQDGESQCLVNVIIKQAVQLQQQEQQLKTQSDMLQRLNRKVKKLTTQAKLNGQQQQQLNKTHSSQSKQVAFSAWYSDSMQIIDVGVNGTLKYNLTVTNIGGGYSSVTGIFTAPVAGIYAFFTSLRSSNNYGWVGLGIFKESTLLVVVTADGKSDPWDRGTGFVTTHLDQGQQVFVRHRSGDSHLEGGGLTTFSGLLVAAD